MRSIALYSNALTARQSNADPLFEQAGSEVAHAIDETVGDLWDFREAQRQPQSFEYARFVINA
jgi:hypothetical protein